MKTAIAVAAILAIGTLDARAALVAYEGFDYDGGSALAGLNGGTGFVAAWTASSNNGSQTVETPGLLGNLSTSANRMVLTGINANNTSNGGRQVLSSNQSTGTVYFSLVMRPDAGNSTSLGYFQLNDSNSNVPVRVGYSVGSFWYIGSPLNGNARTNSTLAPVNGTAVTLLAKVDFDSDIAELWINPSTALGPPDASVNMGTSAYIRFDRMSLRASSGSSGTTTASFDEIRIGTELGDVIAVPEPMTASVIAMAGCLLAVRRRARA